MTTADGFTPIHESRLARSLRELLHTQRVASLGTVDAEGMPFVSMVPYAIEPHLGVLVIHVSALAAHTGNLERHPRCTAMVMQPEAEHQPVHALPRITLALEARTLKSDDDAHAPCRLAYLARFPEAEPMTALPDFRFVQLQVHGARQVAGFGAARAVAADELAAALTRPATPGVLH